MNDIYLNKLEEASGFLKEKGVGKPDVGIILGSGLNSYVDYVRCVDENAVTVKYADIPGFMETKVLGHKGELAYAELNGVKLAILAGRFHYYEGHSVETVVFPTRLLIKLGIRRLIITNASGAINENFGAPSLMLISDHINLTGYNPLIGPNDDLVGPRFPDMTDAYDRALRAELHKKAAECGISLNEGVYVGLTGPSFETPAEIRFLRTIGADAVGMSSVPEAIVANHAGLEIIGISLLSNMAAGITGNAITAEEVNEASATITETVQKVIDLAVGL